MHGVMQVRCEHDIVCLLCTYNYMVVVGIVPALKMYPCMHVDMVLLMRSRAGHQRLRVAAFV